MTSATALRPVSGPAREVYEALRGWWSRPDGPIVVRTSGSTGAAKDVLLSHAALTAATNAAANRLDGHGQWLLDLPPDRAGGLMVLVRSVAAGTSPVLTSDHGSVTAAVAALSEPRCFTALVPTQLHRLAMSGELGSLTRFEAVLVGGASLRPDLLLRCAEEGVRVVRTYGMTETCGGCVYDGHPLDDVGVRLGAEGRIELCGPMMFDGYAGDPELTARVLRDGWLLTDDLGQLDDDGRLQVLGRVDEVVVSGGVNVSLPAVAAAVRLVPGVADAVVVALDDVEWGSRVVACVTCQPGAATPSLTRVREVCARTLPRAWAPRSVVRVAAFPLLPGGGKVDRAALAALAADER